MYPYYCVHVWYRSQYHMILFQTQKPFTIILYKLTPSTKKTWCVFMFCVPVCIYLFVCLLPLLSAYTFIKDWLECGRIDQGRIGKDIVFFVCFCLLNSVQFHLYSTFNGGHYHKAALQEFLKSLYSFEIYVHFPLLSKPEVTVPRKNS